jgi:antitoxin (DNA-binding transcriptional repressor) of toxin-antitoxin stability system
MISAQISVLKNRLSYFLQKVKKGEEIIILDRKVPVAKITKLKASDVSSNNELLLDELERRGIIKRGRGQLPKDFFEKRPPIKLAPGVSALAVLLKMREEAPY